MERLNKVEEKLNNADQLTQLIPSLHSSATASPSYDGYISSPPNSFLCSFDGELLADPVSVSCGHSFERRSIEEHLNQGNYWCPECNMDLSPTEKLMPNIALRNYIVEMKQRNAVKRLRLAVSSHFPEDLESVNRALEDLKDAMTEIPSCVAKAKEVKLISVLALLLKKSLGDTRAILRCLLLIARFSDEYRETMGTTGVIRHLTKLLHGGDPEPDALDILLELSKREAIATKIGNEANSIPTLVSLLKNPASHMAEMARAVLENLSRIEFMITMCKCGYFHPFLELFCREEAGNSEETKALMANELAQMKLTEVAARSLENDRFITSLIELLNSRSPPCISASLLCIKQLISFSEFRSQFMSNEFAIPAVLSLVTKSSEQTWKKEAVEILVYLIQTIQPTDHQTNPRLQVLYSRDSIKAILEQIETSSYKYRKSLLPLLRLIVQKSESVRKWIKSNGRAMSCLFSTALEKEQNDSIRLQALKLIQFIAEANSNEGIALPASPAKIFFVNSLIGILSHSCIEEERSAAAGIISCLPTGDHEIDGILQKSVFLKAINDVFSLTIKNSNELLENAISALQRYAVISNVMPCKQLSKLHPHLVQILCNGSSLAMQRAASALVCIARCSRTPSVNRSSSLSQLKQRIPNMMIPSSKRVFCPAHQSSFPPYSLCLVKVGAVKPLVEMVRTMEPGVSIAALMTLNTACTECGSAAAVEAIAESGGASAIIEVLERGPLPVKEAALELVEKICKHSGMKEGELDKLERVMVHLLTEDDRIRVKAAAVAAEIGLFFGPS